MASTTYYWDEIDDNVCCEEDENGEITASYTHEPGLYGEVIAQKRGDEVRYFNFDGEGNTSELTDDDENVTDTFEYSAFGEEVARVGTTENPFGYKGALGYYTNGKTNDLYIRARTYEPMIGRWLSRDPLWPLDGSDPYPYLLSNPINYIDPSGLFCCVQGCSHTASSLHVEVALPWCSFRQNAQGIAVFGASFKAHAKFDEDLLCDCACCQFRQTVKGYIRWRKFPNDKTWTYQRHEKVWVEDCDPNLGCYGHRHSPVQRARDYYRGGRPRGCEYEMQDDPGLYGVKALAIRERSKIEIQINLDFHLGVYDTCCEDWAETVNPATGLFPCDVWVRTVPVMCWEVLPGGRKANRRP